jgi:hypothetical protein
MAWTLPWTRKAAAHASTEAPADDAWTRHVSALAAQGIAKPGSALDSHQRKPATEADAQALYDVAPSLADLLPWVEYLPDSRSMLLEDSQSSWPAAISHSACSSASRTRTWIAAPGSSMASRIG